MRLSNIRPGPSVPATRPHRLLLTFDLKHSEMTMRDLALVETSGGKHLVWLPRYGGKPLIDFGPDVRADFTDLVGNALTACAEA